MVICHRGLGVRGRAEESGCPCSGFCARQPYRHASDMLEWFTIPGFCQRFLKVRQTTTPSLLASTKATAKVAAADKGRQIFSGWGYYVGLGAAQQ